ncbi:MAG TPA: hypothetical protein VGZ27_09265 [Vicinamibacterales bacterium]|jgi:hypothetical protein|nr:hypothetical protein [Vicinamibacterales bacterium]
MKTVVIVLALLTLAPSASGQSLRVPTIVFAAAAAADWATTATFLSRGASTETDPLLKPFHNRPADTVAAGAVLDVASVYAWNRFIGRHHPKIAIAGLYAAMGFRVFLASKNIVVMRESPAAVR